MTELLAPAGDLEKLRIAYLYGADACYIGGKKYSLRYRASNFTDEDLKEAVKIARDYKKKLYVTVNIVPHNEDLKGLGDYLKYLEEIGVDAIISASFHIIDLAKKKTNLQVHLSTQMSTFNSESVKFFSRLKVDRIVMARELSLKDLKEIKEETKAELEVFIHGGMCAGFSGRCVLSNNLTQRDANRGGCAHSCRWNYDLFYKEEKLNPEGKFFSMASKDLQTVRYIPSLLNIGIDSLKIEGRMKSLYYIAVVVKTYRRLIDLHEKKEEIDFNFFQAEISKAENRTSAEGYFDKGKADNSKTIYDQRSESPKKDFVGIVLDYDILTGIATVEQRNYFTPNQELEFFGPNYSRTVSISEIKDRDGNLLEACRHPLERVFLKPGFFVSKYDLIRII